MRSATFRARAGSAMCCGPPGVRERRPMTSGESGDQPWSVPVSQAATKVRRLRSRLLAHLEHLDRVADLEIVERAQVDAALEALADFGDIVLEAAQPGDVEAIADDRAVAQ